MSLYHETADILSAPPSTGGNLKTRLFGNGNKKNNKPLKSPPQQIYALASETCKWSAVLKEVIDNAELLRHERKLTPLLALLLVHDFLLAKKGIALPASHGLRAAVERHKARLAAELTRARLRRKAASLDALRRQVAAEAAAGRGCYPRWVRVNTLKTTLRAQLDTTFRDFARAASVGELMAASPAAAAAGKWLLHVDEHVPDLLAISPAFEITRTPAYAAGEVILQDKASCFPAYLLDPRPADGDVVDSCSAPGNKTTHVAAIVRSRSRAGDGDGDGEACGPRVHAFEKDSHRARTLEKMVNLAGAQAITRLNPGRDFLKVDPHDPLYRNVGALLLDPSCSGSGIVGRDAMPPIHLPEPAPAPAAATSAKKPGAAPDKGNRKRKREDNADADADAEEEEGEEKKDRRQRQEGRVLVDDDGVEREVASDAELRARLAALSAFQLALLQHALSFPSARRVTYSTCSVHAAENEGVVRAALRSDVARRRGWRVLRRGEQPAGLRAWPVRGSVEASGGDAVLAEACIRSHQDDGRGVMGFFVAGFVRDPGSGDGEEGEGEGRVGMEGAGDQGVVADGRPVSDGGSEAEKKADPESGGDRDLDTGSDGDEDEDEDEGDEWGGFDD
ncbi:S-adenosyl-L-methionine-dependent methyltransferase [Xylaria palmicola]|nr:S-adenosyl-L-methionine-dependent methyltransferase [Xylaria palmicola]